MGGVVVVVVVVWTREMERGRWRDSEGMLLLLHCQGASPVVT